MIRPAHVFFDFHGTLVRTAQDGFHGFQAALGQVMAERFGGTAAAWIAANERVVADWDSYFADLDFGGDDSLAQVREGRLRIVRAFFRLTETPYPPAAELEAWADAYHYEVARRFDGFFPDAHDMLAALADLPLTLGVFTHGDQGYVQGILEGAGVVARFTGPRITPERVGYFGKDEGYVRLAVAAAGVPAGACVFVDDRPYVIRLVVEAGARGVLIDRYGRFDGQAAVTLPDLRGLPDYLRGWLEAEGTTDDHGGDSGL